MNEQTTPKKKRKTHRTSMDNRKRLLVIFAVFSIAFFGLSLRVGWHQIIDGDELTLRAKNQQIKDSVVAATRGNILDRNGNKLAISTTTYTLWVRPDSVKNNGKTDEEKMVNAEVEAMTLAEILQMDYEEVKELITSDKKLVKVAKKLPLDVGEQIREANLSGIELIETATRSYPLNAFASQILGTVNDDNVGNTGLERYYNQYLSGQNGRWITTKDNRSNTLSYGTNKYYAPEDGYDLVLTLDQNIQYIVEQKIAEGLISCQAERVMCLMMDPKTGEILAMAQTNEFDPNNAREPMEQDKEAFAAMTSDEKVAYWNRNWRSFCISDVYEPGSTFKLITTSLSLDHGATYMGEWFYCPGSTTVAGTTLHCWNWPKAHGNETLAQAVQNSCNVTMITLVQRLGKKLYYEGLSSFGIDQKTGVDFPGEGSNIIQSKDSSGPVELATMSYGQGIAVTPISIATAVSSIANEGKLMTPHFLKELRDSDGTVVETYEPVVKSVTVSAQTASDMLTIMESVVNEGGAGTAKIAGYRIGGKTGTANKPEAGGYSATDLYGSFIGVAPVDDPQIVCLVIVDTPRNGKYGSTTAAPIAKEILNETLHYLDIQPEYTKEELKQINSEKTTVPDVVGLSMEDAIGTVAGKELSWKIAPDMESTENMVVVGQFPQAGEYVSKNSIVTLYYEFESVPVDQPEENDETIID
ncbi:MAG: PASTA domain-containing protein [Firmicutes bacterium]|nr:PASTA domain-containing protein [Bacillota bacterium]